MNIYVRYFDYDTVAQSFEEVIEFLSAIPDINTTPELIADVRSYMESDMPYPKRYKIRPRVYFILIKTTAQTLEEFKANRKAPVAINSEIANRKEIKSVQLSSEQEGWYKGTLNFKRVIQIPGTTKFQYQDTRFSALVYAESGQQCYDLIIEHLKNRQDVDLRSQFPSARGNNFTFEYMGEEIPEEVEVQDYDPMPLFFGE